jgi:peroxiredoxin
MTKALRIALAAGTALSIAVAAGYALTRQEAAPRIEYTLLDGSRHSSDALRGKVVLVNFWATSCTICVREMPRMVETYRKFKDRGLDTLAVAMSYDPPAYVINYAESRQLPFAVAIDNTGEIARRYGQVQLTPTTFVLDKQGHIVKRYVGEPDFAQLHQLLAKLLAQT